MKTSKNTASFLSTMRRNKLAQVIAVALAGLLNLRVAEAEADDAVVAMQVDEKNLSSAAALDIDQLPSSPGTANAKLLSAGWQGIPYNLDPAHASNITDAGQHTAFDQASMRLMPGQIGYLVQNGGTLNAADSVIDARADSAKAFVALDGGKIDLRAIQLDFAGAGHDYENLAAGLLAVGENSVINAAHLSISGTPVAGSAVAALGGGQINLDHALLSDGHGIAVQDAGSSVSLKDSEVGGARVHGGSMAIDSSTLHGTLFVTDGGQVDIRHSTLDSQLPGGSGTLQINNDWSEHQARVTVVDSQIIKGPTVRNQAVEITGGVDFNMTGGRIEAADTGIVALRGMGGNGADQNILLDGVQVQIHNTMDGYGRTSGMVIADSGSGDSGHTQVTLRNTELNVSADTAAHEASAIGLSIYGKGIDVLLDQSTVNARTQGAGTGTGAKLNSSDARIELTNGSTLLGQSSGVHVAGRNVDSTEAARLVVDNSAVIGETASAVQADHFGKLDVRVQNGGSLQSGNGIALNVQSQADVNLTVDNSHVSGDIVSDNQVAEQVYGYDPDTWQALAAPFKSSAKVTLQNQAVLSGAASQVDALSIDENSRWNMTADSDVGRLHNDGDVAFAPAGNGFKTLTVQGDLSGKGTFHMNTDLAALEGDLLTVQGQAEGAHTLVVADSGRAPSAAEQQLMLVDTNGGNGQFNLHGKHVDAGAFRYTLEQQGDDWFLRNTAANPGDPAPQNLSTGANAALGNQAATATLWNAQMNALVKRLGELRMGQDDGGVWARGIGKHFDVDNGTSRGFDQDVVGMEIGADTAIPLDGGKLYVGGMLGTARSDQDFGEGASGQIDSKLIGAYATWLDENGYYVDTVAKYNRFDSKVKSTTNVGEQVKGDYKSQGYGADIEVGKHVTLQEGWFVEPQVELSYTHTGGADYDTSNGMRVEAADADSLQGRVGSLFGRSMKMDNGMHVQPYVKASYVHEFNGNSNVSVNGVELDNKISGSRTELGLGGVLQVSEKTKVSLDVEQASGDDVEQPWAINLGVRYLW